MLNCERCNGETLIRLENGEYECKACGAVFSPTAIAKYADILSEYVSEVEQKTIANARRNLWTEANKNYLNNSEILKWSNEILKYLPTDFYATLYKTVCIGNTKQLNELINSIDLSSHYKEIEYVVEFVLKAIVEETLLCLNNLIDRVYKGKDLELYEKMTTILAKRAKEVNEGVYNLNITRDVFVAYRSDDMERVEDVVSALESAGLSCFVSMRNLQHGRGAVDNYQSALERAIDNCKTVLFISTEKARNFSCDAVKFELPYIKHTDLQKNPMYRDSYETMPLKYKKFRVQLVVGALPNVKNAADRFVNGIFYGYEYAYSVDEAVDRISQSITTRIIEEIEDSDEKICLNCGSKNKLIAKDCIKCGRGDFCETIEEYRDHLTEKTNKLMEEKADLDRKMEEEKAALLKQIEELKKKAQMAKEQISSEKIGGFTIDGFDTSGFAANKTETSNEDNVENLLVNARYLLEVEDYDGVSRVCDEIYKLVPDNPELWILKTLCEVRQNRLYKVARLSIDLTRSVNFQKAVRYGKGDEIEKLKKFVAQALKNYNEFDENREGLWNKNSPTKKISDFIDDKRKKIETEITKRKMEIEAEKQRDIEARAKKQAEKSSQNKYINKSVVIMIFAVLVIVAQAFIIQGVIGEKFYTHDIGEIIALIIAVVILGIIVSVMNKTYCKNSKIAKSYKLKSRYVIAPISTLLFFAIWVCQTICVVFIAISIFTRIF